MILVESWAPLVYDPCSAHNILVTVALNHDMIYVKTVAIYGMLPFIVLTDGTADYTTQHQGEWLYLNNNYSIYFTIQIMYLKIGKFTFCSAKIASTYESFLAR